MEKLFSNKIIPFIVSLSFFLEAVDSTIINTAIPTMAHSLKVEPINLKVALISYLLSLAIFIPISGWITDKYGDKKTFISALLIFSLSSFWCGFATNLYELVIGRLVQGFGGALSLPVGRLIIIRTFGRENLITMMNRVVTVGALGIMLGPTIGGFIVHFFSWHWIFWVNIPVGFLAMVLAYFYLKETPPSAVPPLDKVGFVLFGLGLAGITFSLSQFSELSNDTYRTCLFLLISIGIFISYIVYSKTKPFPVVRTQLFRYRTFQISIVGNIIARIGFGGIPFLVPLLLQIGLGYPADVSGLLLSPLAVGIIISKPWALPLLRRFGYRNLLINNTILIAFAIWFFIVISKQTSVMMIVFIVFLYGLIVTLQYSFMNSLAFSEILTEELSAATSITSTAQQLSQSFGVAFAAIFIRIFSDLLGNNVNLNVAVFHYTFFAVGAVTLLSTIIFLKLKPEDGQQMIL